MTVDVFSFFLLFYFLGDVTQFVMHLAYGHVWRASHRGMRFRIFVSLDRSVASCFTAPNKGNMFKYRFTERIWTPADWHPTQQSQAPGVSITGCSHSPVRVNRRKICAHIQQPDNDHCAGFRYAILPMPNKGACHKTTTTLSGYIAFRRSAPGSRIACGDEQLILQFNTSFTPFNRIEMLIFLGTTLTLYKYTLLPSLLL